MDVRVFSPISASSTNYTMMSCYRRHEAEKRIYDERIRQVERGTFTPLVFSPSGGMGQASKVFFIKD